MEEEKKILESYLCDDMINIIVEYLVAKCEKCKVFNYDCSDCNEIWMDCWKEH